MQAVSRVENTVHESSQTLSGGLPSVATGGGAMEHRRQMRGMLALIRAIVRRTSSSATSVHDFVAHLNGRLDTIARVQEILMRDSPQFDLAELLSDEILRQGMCTARIDLPSSSLYVSRPVAASLALAFHELATNAIKFGQLGDPSRRIRIAWRPTGEGDDQTVLTWTERAQPSGHGSPVAPGFGFELIRNTLPYEIGARTRIDVTADGLFCEIIFVSRGGTC